MTGIQKIVATFSEIITNKKDINVCIFSRLRRSIIRKPFSLSLSHFMFIQMAGKSNGLLGRRKTTTDAAPSKYVIVFETKLIDPVFRPVCSWWLVLNDMLMEHSNIPTCMICFPYVLLGICDKSFLGHAIIVSFRYLITWIHYISSQ